MQTVPGRLFIVLKLSAKQAAFQKAAASGGENAAMTKGWFQPTFIRSSSALALALLFGLSMIQAVYAEE
ncbi:MAG: hypothetical protein ACR2RE_24130, partial [Geminicoccaceae bacterium]